MIAIAKGASINAAGLGELKIIGVRHTGHKMRHDHERGFIIRKVFTVYLSSNVEGYYFMVVEIEESPKFEIVPDE